MKNKDQICNPDPEATIESNRSLGYDLNIAISDLIDNSITAKSKSLWILHKWNGKDSFIVIYDDGAGMNDDELFSAMRMGSTSPNVKREPTDLGRFGLGLKVASWSQCRVLTVATKNDSGKISLRKWDIDYVSKKNAWLLLSDTDKQSNTIITNLLEKADTGTVVLWQNLDRLITLEGNDDENEQYFYEKIENLKLYISMIFHRYMSGPQAIKIYISHIDEYGNEKAKLKPWDPFLEKNTNTQDLGTETIRYKNNAIHVTPFILPHHSKYATNIQFRQAGGLFGWNAHQGFFIYRQRRLLMHGGWLGFAKPEDHYKLARIRIDIPNSMDSDWKIGVKKVRVEPPDIFKKELKKYSEISREKAAKVYRYRGAIDRRGNPQIKELIWKRYKNRAGEVSYKIERKHPVIEALIKEAGNKSKVNTLLGLVEKTVPVETIIVSDRDDPNAHVKYANSSKEDKIPLKKWYNEHMELLTKKLKMTRGDAFKKLLTIEPFNYYIKDLEAFRGAEINE